MFDSASIVLLCLVPDDQGWTFAFAHMKNHGGRRSAGRRGTAAVGVAMKAELARAIMAPDHSTRAFVKLGSRVAYEDLESGVVRRLTLCLPEDASLDDLRLSVLTPVGAALIGATAGQVLDYVVGGRARRLRILEVQDE